MAKMTKQRRSLLIGELCRLSRNGWANARPEDYQPIEAELYGAPVQNARAGIIEALGGMNAKPQEVKT